MSIFVWVIFFLQCFIFWSSHIVFKSRTTRIFNKMWWDGVLIILRNVFSAYFMWFRVVIINSVAKWRPFKKSWLLTFSLISWVVKSGKLPYHSLLMYITDYNIETKIRPALVMCFLTSEIRVWVLCYHGYLLFKYAESFKMLSYLCGTL